MTSYYNEHDPFAAAWLRELIKAGLIADGEVDERSIDLVQPDDVRGFVQCHFFAGIGGWSYALRLAGWPDDRPVWTGSCPCQPFSSAGAQAGGDDARDLWPTWVRIIRECRPHVVFGEQVEVAIGHGWLDRVCDDLEAEGYAIGAVGLPSVCVGAFDIRQRLWFVADRDGSRCTSRRAVEAGDGRDRPREQLAGLCDAGELADPDGERRTGQPVLLRPEATGWDAPDLPEAPRRGESFWANAVWIPCADGKYRPIEPGTFPLAHGVSARVGRLRGYGNAIKPQVAQVFIEAYCEARGL